MSERPVSLTTPPAGYTDWLGELKTRTRTGQAVTNFAQCFPAPLSDLARESLKDPYRFDFLGLHDDDKTQPMVTAECKLLESLPAERQTSLPSIEQIERELAALLDDEENQD